MGKWEEYFRWAAFFSHTQQFHSKISSSSWTGHKFNNKLVCNKASFLCAWNSKCNDFSQKPNHRCGLALTGNANFEFNDKYFVALSSVAFIINELLCVFLLLFIFRNPVGAKISFNNRYLTRRDSFITFFLRFRWSFVFV